MPPCHGCIEEKRYLRCFSNCPYKRAYTKELSPKEKNMEQFKKFKQRQAEKLEIRKESKFFKNKF